MRHSRTDRVIAYLSERAGHWIDGLALASVGGAYAWRSRVSDARKQGYRIDNRQRKEGSRTVSEYRLVRSTPRTLSDLWSRDA
jgi:hypothetical protein